MNRKLLIHGDLGFTTGKKSSSYENNAVPGSYQLPRSYYPGSPAAEGPDDPATMPRSHHLGELQHAIMRVLWEAGEATVAEVRGALEPKKRRAPTTIATMLTKMEKKGVVAHRVEGRQFVYRPTVSEEEVTRTMVADLTQRLFEGDVTALVSHLLSEQEIDARELQGLRRLIARREKEERDGDR